MHAFQYEFAFNYIVTGFKHIQSDDCHTKVELLAGRFGSKRIHVRLESKFNSPIHSRLEFYGEKDPKGTVF